MTQTKEQPMRRSLEIGEKFGNYIRWPLVANVAEVEMIDGTGIGRLYKSKAVTGIRRWCTAIQVIHDGWYRRQRHHIGRITGTLA